jgi:hypothetical protein
MIESLENIMKHSIFPEDASDPRFLPTLTVSKTNDHFAVNSSNPLGIEDIPRLKARIDYLNGLDQQSLKGVYKDTITDGVFTKTGGAGLGLIEMVKISCNPIRYEFYQIDQSFARYMQYVTINAER